MKRVLAALALLSLCMAFTPPKPKTPVIAVSVRADEAAGMFWVRYVITAAGSPDSVAVSTAQSAPQLRVGGKYLVFPVRDSVSFPLAGFGVGHTGDVNATSYRRALRASAPAKTWSYTEPSDTPPPAPTIDSVTTKAAP